MDVGIRERLAHVRGEWRAALKSSSPRERKFEKNDLRSGAGPRLFGELQWTHAVGARPKMGGFKHAHGPLDSLRTSRSRARECQIVRFCGRGSGGFYDK